MVVRLIRSERLYQGVPYAYAAATPAGSVVFTAGACPLDAAGQVVAPADIASQARQALANLRVALEECGCGFSDVLKTTVFVASNDRSDLVTAWNEVASAFGEHDAPSTLLGVATLGYEGQLVEIEAVAARQ
jgi:enamine deaminase RidA (YjgF/YER057c/UK114 family)